MKCNKIIFCLLGCLVLWMPATLAQQVKVSARLDTTSILLGDQTILRLSATFPAKAHINFPVLTDTLSSKLMIVEAGKTDTVKAGASGLQTITQQFTITSFDAGVQTVPAFTFETTEGKLQTEPMPLQVIEVKVDTTKAIYDIKQPLGVSYSWTDWLRDNWYWVLAALLVVAGIVGSWFYFKKRKKPERIVLKAPEPVVPAHVVAIEKLYVLKDKKLWEQGQVKAYYVELTDILREFLERRYQISAMEQTSEEIFNSLRKRELTEGNKALLKQVLSLADLVKFAKATPSGADSELSMQNAVDFVKSAAATEPLSETKSPEA